MPLPAIAPIRSGWIAAISDMFALNAQAQDWGVHMAAADLNEQGGLLGRKIEIILRDSPAAMLCIVLIRATFDPQGDDRRREFIPLKIQAQRPGTRSVPQPHLRGYDIPAA